MRIEAFHASRVYTQDVSSVTYRHSYVLNLKNSSVKRLQNDLGCISLEFANKLIQVLGHLTFETVGPKKLLLLVVFTLAIQKYIDMNLVEEVGDFFGGKHIFM